MDTSAKKSTIRKNEKIIFVQKNACIVSLEQKTKLRIKKQYVIIFTN